MKVIQKNKYVVLFIVILIIVSGVLLIHNDASPVRASSNTKMNCSKITLRIGKTKQLKLIKSNDSKKKIRWKSSNKKIATVSSKGLVKAKKKGSVTITAKVGKKKYTCKVTVKDKLGETSKMNLKIGKYIFEVELEDNKAVSDLKNMLKQGNLTLKLSDYAGNEKVGPLGKKLSSSDKRTTTHSGDIVLYCGNQIVMFYGSNTWEYTRIGKVKDLTDWKKALGSGNVEVTLLMK